MSYKEQKDQITAFYQGADIQTQRLITRAVRELLERDGVGVSLQALHTWRNSDSEKRRSPLANKYLKYFKKAIQMVESMAVEQ